MERILENKFYSLILLWITIGALMLYAYMGSRSITPELTLPASVTSIKGVSGRKPISFDSLLTTNGLETLKTLRALRSFDSAILLVGGFKTAVEFVINRDDRNRYLVTDNRIELGSRWLEQSGQVQKALTKAWIFQLARTDITSSLLRTEVASDLLWAMLNGDLAIDGLQFPEVQNWMLFAQSFGSHCQSSWISPELSGLCAGRQAATADSIQTVGFRPLLDSMIWTVYAKLPMIKRIEFIKAFTSWIVEPPPVPELVRPKSIADWKTWIKSEYTSLMPASIPGMMLTESIHSVEQLAALDSESKPLEIKYLFRNEHATFKDSELLGNIVSIGNEKFWKSPVLAMVKTKDGYVTLPGRARVPDDVVQMTHFKEMVLEACQEPSLNDLMKDKVSADRILYVRECQKPFAASYSPLITLGVKGFAAANPKLAFALLQKPFMQIAVDRGWTGRDELLKDLLNKSAELSSVSPNMGLRQAHWFPEVRAYKVVGAVEAVEWYRSIKD